MPRGITPTRARRRQSDAKWRASVAICYEIMKNVIPDHKKLGRRKVSKALTLKETERHIVNLEATLKDLINQKAKGSGKLLMLEKGDKILYPATLEDIKQDFATKQLSFFASTNTGKKRYNVPADIEASLESLSEQVCPLVALKLEDLAGERTQPIAEPQLQYPEQDCPAVVPVSAHLRQPSAAATAAVSCLKRETVDHLMLDISQRTPLKTWTKSGNSKTVLPINTPPSLVKPAGQQPWTTSAGRDGPQERGGQRDLKSISLIPSGGNVVLNNTPLKSKRKPSFTSTSSSGAGCGFTPVKLPLGLDPSLPSTPGEHALESAFSPFSTVQTPSSCLGKGLDYLDFTDVEEDAQLFCAESIENIELDEAVVPTSTPSQSKSQDSGVLDCKVSDSARNSASHSVTDSSVTSGPAQPKSAKTGKKCRRRLDQSYSSESDTKQRLVDSCLDFDGFLLFYRQHVGSMDGADNDRALEITRMWESLGADDRATYTEMASLEHSDDSNDLSDDLLEIDLKPFYSPHRNVKSTEASPGGPQESSTGRRSQEVPNLAAHTSLLTSPRQNLFPETFRAKQVGGEKGDEYIQLIPEYEDLGIICSQIQDDDLDDRNHLDGCQVVPDWVPS